MGPLDEENGVYGRELGNFKSVGKTEYHIPEGDSVAGSKAKFLAAAKTKLQSTVGAVKREVLRATVQKTLRDIFLSEYERAGEGKQDTSFQLIKYVLTHQGAVGSVESMFSFIFDK